MSHLRSLPWESRRNRRGSSERGSGQDQRLRDRFEESILKSVAGAEVNGEREHRLPNTTNIAFEGIESEGALMLLDERGICCSAGSACTSGSVHPSHVLKAMGFSNYRARSSLQLLLSGDSIRRKRSTSPAPPSPRLLTNCDGLHRLKAPLSWLRDLRLFVAAPAVTSAQESGPRHSAFPPLWPPEFPWGCLQIPGNQGRNSNPSRCFEERIWEWFSPFVVFGTNHRVKDFQDADRLERRPRPVRDARPKQWPTASRRACPSLFRAPDYRLRISRHALEVIRLTYAGRSLPPPRSVQRFH